MVDDQYAGSSGSCVECGKPITVPHIDRRQIDSPQSDSRLAAKKRSILPVLSVIIGAVVISVLGITFLVIVIFPSIQRIRGDRTAR